MTLGYASTYASDSLGIGSQVTVLKEAGAQRIYEDEGVAGRSGRPGLELLLSHALQEGNVVLVERLDRFSRSLRDVLRVLVRIHDVGATVRTLEEELDTATAGGIQFVEVVRKFLTFERALMRESTRLGIEMSHRWVPRSRGGRKPKLSAEQREEAVRLVQAGQATRSEVARRMNVHPSTISRLVANSSSSGVTNKRG